MTRSPDAAALTPLLAVLPVPALLVDGAGTVAAATDAARQLFGADKVVGARLSDLLLGWPDDPALWRDGLHRALGRVGDGLLPVSLRIADPHPAGSPRDGARTGWLIVLHDISDEVALAVRDRPDTDATAQEGPDDPVGHFAYDPKTDALAGSPAWAALMAMAAQSGAGTPPDWRARIHPDDLPAVGRAVRLAGEGAAPRVHCDFRLRGPNDLDWRWRHTVMMAGRRDAAGGVATLIGATVDTTDRHDRIDAVTRSTRQFISAFSGATVGQAIIGLDGAFMHVNAALCDMLGYAPEVLSAQTFRTLTHPDDLDESLHRYAMLVAGEVQTYQTERRYLRADGSVIFALLTVGLVRDKAGQPLHFVSQLVDVTAQRRLMTEQAAYFRKISHDLRTPLTSIMGALTLLGVMEDAALTAETRRLVQIAQENSQRLNRMIQEIGSAPAFATVRDGGAAT